MNWAIARRTAGDVLFVLLGMFTVVAFTRRWASADTVPVIVCIVVVFFVRYVQLFARRKAV